MRKFSWIFVIFMLDGLARGQTSQYAEDAAGLYSKAGQMIGEKEQAGVRTEQPFYGFYADGDLTKRPYAERRQGGQFRDVASWAPAGKWPQPATTQALPG